MKVVCAVPAGLNVDIQAREGITVVDELGLIRSMAAEAKNDVGQFIRANYTFKELAP